jgi:hypothetical protein
MLHYPLQTTQLLHYSIYPNHTMTQNPATKLYTTTARAKSQKNARVVQLQNQSRTRLNPDRMLYYNNCDKHNSPQEALKGIK